MNKISRVIEKYTILFVNFADSNHELKAIKHSMVALFPLTLFGSFLLIVLNFPYLDHLFPGFHTFLNELFAKGLIGTIGSAGVILLISVAYNYSVELNINPIHGLSLAMSCWVTLVATTITTPAIVSGTQVPNAIVNGVISLDDFSSYGMVASLIIGLLAVRVYAMMLKINVTYKIPEVVPQNVVSAFTSLFPFSITMLTFMLISYVFSLTEFETFNSFIYQFVSIPLLKFSNFPITIVLITFFQQILWFLGMHGTTIVTSLFAPLWTNASLINMEAFKDGIELPYKVSQATVDVYITTGAGGIMAFILASIISAKSNRFRSTRKIGAIPAVFNIQEPVTFGIPIVCNPILFFPFVFIPTIQIGVIYVLMNIGFAPIPVMQVPWSTPIIISGLLTTNFNIMGAITQIIMMLIAIIVWLPFIKVADKLSLRAELENKD